MLLERLKDPSLLPAEVNKLVILDCTRLRVHWRAGILDNTFAARLPQAVQEASVPNLVVLCASSPGETSWVSPESSGSVFGHYLSVALAGEADGVLPGIKADKWVSLHELRHYLEASVNAWAQRHRGERQRPMLLPAGTPGLRDLFGLEAKRATGFPGDVGAGLAGADSQLQTEIDALWLQHDDLLARAPYRADPLAWHQFEQRLLWLEQAAAAGEAYTSSAHSLLNQLKRYTSGEVRPVAAA